MKTQVLSKNLKALPLNEEYEEFRRVKNVREARIEKFFGVDGYDVYNPSVPFLSCGKTVIAGRIEKRDNEVSHVRFFESAGKGEWNVINGTPHLPLQDPYITKADNGILLGGVMLNYCKTEPHRVTDWQMDFYYGPDIFNLKLLFSGPKSMKDIRITQLRDGRYAIFTRPNGEKITKKYGCVCKVGFTIANRLSDITAELIENAPFVEGLFIDTEWGGVNHCMELGNGLIGAIGHKSRFGNTKGLRSLHYYGIAFALRESDLSITPLKVIISNDCFPPVCAKREDLIDITFTAGIIRKGGGSAEIFTGLSDTSVGYAVIPDPFDEYEDIKW